MARLQCWLLLAACLQLARGDPTDWVNPIYVQSAAKHLPPGTQQAIQTILRLAVKSARGGPWSITDTSVTPPSGNPRDYLSWAPYWWPACNWCDSKGRSTATPPLRQSNTQPPSGDYDDEDDQDQSLQRRALAGQLWSWQDEQESAQHGESPWPNHALRDETSRDITANWSEPTGPAKRDFPTDPAPALPSTATSQTTASPASTQTAVATSLENERFKARASSNGNQPKASPSKSIVANRPTLAATPKPNQPGSQCTVSSTSVAPTATYSTCKYERRDGQVNPDVRTLNSTAYVGQVTQAGIMNALAWALTRDQQYSQSASLYIDTFFASSSTGMNPHLNYGQVVRGPPGSQQGSFMAIIDLRGIVKVANAVQLLRQSEAPDWTVDRDRRMVIWARSYLNWLQTSPIGRKAGQAANNHGTFYASQVASLQILIGDYNGARSTLVAFFSGIFKDQIASNGDQPFESIRTRPYHYRAFNLEGLIANAKLADQLGVNMWQVKSKYGATVQTAVDFAMKSDCRNENNEEMVPHVLAAAAVYGDPDGRYREWVAKVLPEYDAKVYYFYNQVSAFTSSSASGHRVRPAVRRSEVAYAPYWLHMGSDVLSSSNGGIVIDIGPQSHLDIQLNEIRNPGELAEPLKQDKRQISAQFPTSKTAPAISSQFSDVLHMREGNAFV